MRLRPFAGLSLIFLATLLSIGGVLSIAADERAARVDAATLIEHVYNAAQNDVSAGFSVSVSGSSFSPPMLDIQVGDTVTWTRASGFHNVRADDGSFSSGAPSSAWTTFSRTFTQEGMARYFCQVHGASGGGGMAGVINVHAPGATATPTATPTSTPTPTNTPGGTIPPPVTPTPQTVVVDTRDFEFAPKTITLYVGDTVQWQRSNGFHNVRADDNSFNNGLPSNTWSTFSRTFDQAGTFPYHCEEHGAAGGVGMAGVINVHGPGATSTPTATPTATPKATPGSALQAYLPYVSRANTPTPTHTSTPSPTPPIPPNLLVNPDFEQGSGVGWEEFSAQGWDVIVEARPGIVPPHSGSWLAWLGEDDDEIAFVRQSVKLSACATVLTFWVWIASEDVCGYDFGGVLVNSMVVSVFDLCEDSSTDGWVLRTVNLSANVEQNVTLEVLKCKSRCI